MGEREPNEWFDWIKIIVVALLLALVVRTYFFSPIIVDGPSMQPTLINQDKMIVNKFIYYVKDPDRFDIVIFHANDEKDFIKRVIGLPGEHVKVEDNQLYIDGEKVEQPFLESGQPEDEVYPTITNDFSLEQLSDHYDVIPEGYVFVLGDNRSNSTDSRSSSLGLVSMEQIVGKTSIVFWPFNRIQIVNE